MQTMSEGFFAVLFFILVGGYLIYFGSRKLSSRKFFVRDEGLPAKNVDEEYRRIPPGDRLNERYLAPIGWIILGLAFTLIGLYLLLRS